MPVVARACRPSLRRCPSLPALGRALGLGGIWCAGAAARPWRGQDGPLAHTRRALQAPAGPPTVAPPDPPGLGNGTWYAPTVGVPALFGPSGRPSLAEDDEGATPDCYLGAAVGSVVLADDGFLLGSARSVPQHDDQFDWRFFYQGQPEWQRVQTTWPMNAAGYEGIAPRTEDGRQVVWMSLLEKGYVEFHDRHPDVSVNRAPGYQGIDGGFGNEALTALTGVTAALSPAPSGQHILDMASAVDARANLVVVGTTDLGSLTTAPGFVAANQSLAFADGTTLSILADQQVRLADARGDSVIVVASHAYTLLGSAGAGTVSLRNPWGFDPNGPSANFTISAPLLSHVADLLAIGALPDRGLVPPAPPWPVTPGQPAAGLAAGAIVAICIGAGVGVVILGAAGRWVYGRVTGR